MDKTKIIEIWVVLESLVVSLDRIGSYQFDNGKEAALKEIGKYLSPENCKRFAKARSLINEIIEDEFPGSGIELDNLTENEQLIGYWQYPNKK